MLGQPEGLNPPLFHHCLMTTTTAPAKPRRRRAKRKPATVTMNQQQPISITLPEGNGKLTKRPMKAEIPTPRTRPDVELISREAYWNDYQNRMKIHDYEFNEAMNDLKKLAAWTNDSIKKLLKRIETVEL